VEAQNIIVEALQDYNMNYNKMISYEDPMPSYAELEESEVLCGLKKTSPTLYSSYDGQIIENLYILASPTDDTAL
jgi:hypothetical protein